MTKQEKLIDFAIYWMKVNYGIYNEHSTLSMTPLGLVTVIATMLEEWDKMKEEVHEETQ